MMDIVQETLKIHDSVEETVSSAPCVHYCCLNVAHRSQKTFECKQQHNQGVFLPLVISHFSHMGIPAWVHCQD